jgi:NAD(P)H-dependent FMN reductase
VSHSRESNARRLTEHTENAQNTWMSPVLYVVVCSVRVKRAGLPVATWFFQLAQQHAKFDVHLIDLREINLPMFDEPNHPRLQRYEFEHTKAWSRLVAHADAFVFVTPEYNFGTPPALNNALNYLYLEWHYKPAAFVSYGGLSGGTRSVQMTRQTMAALSMVAVTDAVHIPFIARLIEEGAFKATPDHAKAAHSLLDSLFKWTEALRPMRSP